MKKKMFHSVKTEEEKPVEKEPELFSKLDKAPVSDPQEVINAVDPTNMTAHYRRLTKRAKWVRITKDDKTSYEGYDDVSGANLKDVDRSIEVNDEKT